MAAVQETVDRVRSIEVDAYKYGFVSPIESDMAPKGLNEDTVRFISEKKGEPEWLLEWRLEAFRRWQTMEEPKWARVSHPPINYQEIYYFAAPKSGPALKSLDEVDPELLRTYAKLVSRWSSRKSSPELRGPGSRSTPSSTRFRLPRRSRPS